MTVRRRGTGAGRLLDPLGWPMLVLLGVFFFTPLVMVLSLSLRNFDYLTLTAAGFTLDNFTRFVADGFYIEAFLRTMLIAAATTVLSVVVGYPVAWHLYSVRSSRLRAWLTLIVLMPLMLSLVVSAFAWLIILGSNGLVSTLLSALGLIGERLRILNTDIGVVIVTTYSFMSFPILSIYAALANIDPNAHRAARLHGASEFQTFRHVTLPLSIPGVISGALIVFSLTMAAFVIPYLIGGGRVKVIGLLIYNFTVQLFDWAGAAALGVLLLAVTLVLGWLMSVAAQRWTPWERRG